MSPTGPLRSMLFRYRRRKHMSLDGTVPGLEPVRCRRQYDATRAPVFTGGGTPHADGGYLGGRLPEDFEPHPGFMADTAPCYESPEDGRRNPGSRARYGQSGGVLVQLRPKSIAKVAKSLRSTV
jgi:hypothetical protein